MNVSGEISGIRLTGDVHGHLFNLCAVELLDLSHHAYVIGGDKVDCNALSAKPATATDPVDVILTVGRQVIVDDEGHLLHVNATGKKVSGDQDARRTRAKLLHDHVTLALLHIAVHSGHGEVAACELVREPVDLSPRVAEDNGLGDGYSLVQVAQRVQLPVLFLDCNIELLNTFESELGLLDENADWVAHELRGDLEDVLWHGGGEQNHLGRLGKQLENIVDLLGEAARQHLVGLVENEHLHGISLEEAALDHVLDTAGGSNDDLWAVLESLHVVTNARASNAGVAVNAHEVTDGNHNLLNLLCQFAGRGKDECLAGLELGVDILEGGDGKCSGLSSARLSLCDNIATCYQC